jgi:hypothetical protein
MLSTCHISVETDLMLVGNCCSLSNTAIFAMFRLKLLIKNVDIAEVIE